MPRCTQSGCKWLVVVGGCWLQARRSSYQCNEPTDSQIRRKCTGSGATADRRPVFSPRLTDCGTQHIRVLSEAAAAAIPGWHVLSRQTCGTESVCVAAAAGACVSVAIRQAVQGPGLGADGHTVRKLQQNTRRPAALPAAAAILKSRAHQLHINGLALQALAGEAALVHRVDAGVLAVAPHFLQLASLLGRAGDILVIRSEPVPASNGRGELQCASMLVGPECRVVVH